MTELTIGVILAAGASRRYGSDDKLTATLAGKPLATYAAEAMAEARLDRRSVVCPIKLTTLFPEFQRIDVEPGLPQSASLAAAARWAKSISATRLLIALADMPFITSRDLDAVLDCAGAGAACVTDGSRRMPPACFPAESFDELMAATGDQGARSILRALPASQTIPLPSDRLSDIDTPEQLAAALRR